MLHSISSNDLISIPSARKTLQQQHNANLAESLTDAAAD